VKPKLPNQFKAAEVNGTPMSIIIGEDEIAQGKIKIKENGLRDGHPEKEGVLVNLTDLVYEVKQRLRRKANLDNMTKEAEGLRVVGGIKSEVGNGLSAGESDKPTEEQSLPQDAIGGVPA
jgi:histidyl-tRNA synthetase